MEDNLQPALIRDAVAAKVLGKELDNLSGRAVRTSRETQKVNDSLDKQSSSARKAGSELDRYSGRLRTIADVIAILGPGLVPVAALGVPAVAGLASELGAVVLAGGTAVLAFQGIGDTLKAVNAAALEPTTQNLEKARLAMSQLSPAAQDFVRELHQLGPVIEGLQGAAGSGLFPGLGEALAQLATAAPRVESILERVGQTLGGLSVQAADALTGPEWSDFIRFIEAEAPLALAQMGHAIGSVAHGLAELAMAAAPLNHSFGDWLVSAADGFDKWASGLSKTQGFTEFVDYLRQNGPVVAEAVSSIANALLQILEAAAPLGGPVLKALTAVADVIARLADSNAGPAIMATVTALALLNRAQSAFGAVAETSWGKAVKAADGYQAKVGQIAKRGALPLAGLALAASGVSEKFGLANTATLALTGSIAGPWGAAMGGAVGLLLDFAGGQKQAVTNADTLTGTLDQQTGAITQNTAAYVANQYASSGILKTAQALHLNLADVTQAALGNSEALERVNDQATAYEATLSGNVPKLSEFADNWGDVKEAIGDTSGQLEDGQSRLHLMAEAMGTTAVSTDRATSATEDFTAALDRMNNRLERRASARDYQAALDDFTKSVKENGRTLDITTEKGRANQAALDNIASTAIKVAQGLKGTARVEALTQARKDFVDAASKILGSDAAARQLANRLGLLNRTKAEPKVDFNAAAAMAKINDVRDGINSLHDKTITITTIVNRRGGVTSTAGGHSAPLEEHHALGGHITGPGGPTDDRIPAWLSNGEFVMRAAAVQKYGLSTMHQMNAMQLAAGGLATARDRWALAAGGLVMDTRTVAA